MLRRAATLIAGLLVGCGLLLGVVWLLTIALENREAKYNGKDATDWAAALRNPDPAVAQVARMVVTNQVIPALRAQIFNDTNDSQLKLKLVEWLNTLPLVTITSLEAPTRRYEAARNLGMFGPDAASALPDLIRAVKGADGTARAGAIEALGKIRTAPETVVPLLITCLDDPDDDIQLGAIDARREFGPEAKAAVPKIQPFLRAHSKELPPAARKALAAIDPSALPGPRD